MELRPGTTILDADSYSHNYRIESWLGRVNYNYNEKYYLSASLRTDASSRFHKDYRWGTFWSVGANWRISEENFLKNADWLDNLSLKASYGEQGNDAVGTYYAWQSLYSLAYANANNKGALIGSLENREISWEKNGNLNVGVEASFFNGRLTASLEYFHKKTFDMLLNYPMALSTGFDGYDANVGDMKNYGFEFDLRAVPVRTRDFEWGVSVMGTAANNKVVRLTKESPELLSGVRIIKEGYPINTYYVSKTAGVDPSTGQLLYWAYDKDDNGDMVPGSERITTDYTEANNSRYFMGSRMPKLFGSVGTDLTWKGITLSVLTTYSIGGKVFDGLYASSMEPLYSNTNWHKNVLRRWQQPGDITDVPRAEINPSTASYQDRFLINASYFSIKNITLGYQLPKSWMQAAKLAGVRVFGSVDNLATFGYLNGMNPTYNFSGGTDYVYVPTKTWSVGLEVNF